MFETNTPTYITLLQKAAIPNVPEGSFERALRETEFKIIPRASQPVSKFRQVNATLMGRLI